jgi:hypothetical protein
MFLDELGVPSLIDWGYDLSPTLATTIVHPGSREHAAFPSIVQSHIHAERAFLHAGTSGKWWKDSAAAPDLDYSNWNF